MIAAVAVVAPLLLAGITAAVPAAQAAPQADGQTRINFADPDMIRSGDDYYAYATSAGNPKGCKYTGRGKKNYLVPMIRTKGDGAPSLAACPTGDALLRPSAKLVDSKSGIWAPSVVRAGKGKFFMYYAATKAGTQQKCLFRAKASSASGPFKDSREFACPPDGRWAIDPDAYRAPDGTMYLAYRDDAPVKFPETALSAVELDGNGFARWNTRVTLATSKWVSWDTVGTGHGATSVIENPSIVKYRGRFLVSYSGNDWKSARYSTGLLDCGGSLLGGTKCRPLSRADHPYFGHAGKGMHPVKGLPGDPKGAGGMSLFTGADGKAYVIYHHLDNLPKTSRKSVLGEFHYDPATGNASVTKVG